MATLSSLKAMEVSQWLWMETLLTNKRNNLEKKKQKCHKKTSIEDKINKVMNKMTYMMPGYPWLPLVTMATPNCQVGNSRSRSWNANVRPGANLTGAVSAATAAEKNWGRGWSPRAGAEPRTNEKMTWSETARRAQYDPRVRSEPVRTGQIRPWRSALSC